MVPGGRGQVLALGGVEDGHDVPGVRRAEPVPALHLDDDAVRVRLLPAVQPDAEIDVLGRDALGLGLGVVVLGADGARAEDVEKENRLQLTIIMSDCASCQAVSRRGSSLFTGTSPRRDPCHVVLCRSNVVRQQQLESNLRSYMYRTFRYYM